MSLALSICVLSISVMQSVNGAQFLNTYFLLTLFGLPPACAVTVSSTYKYIRITKFT